MIEYTINLSALMTVHKKTPGQVLNHLATHHKSITYETLSNWRKGKTVPDAIQAKWLANLFGITTDGLYTILDKKTIQNTP